MISYMISYMISQTLKPLGMCISSLAEVNLPPAQHSDASNGNLNPEQEMD